MERKERMTKEEANTRRICCPLCDKKKYEREANVSLLKQVNKILINSNSWLENTHEPLNQAFGMAIKALEQEPCKDAISRQEVAVMIASMKTVAEKGKHSLCQVQKDIFFLQYVLGLTTI